MSPYDGLSPSRNPSHHTFELIGIVLLLAANYNNNVTGDSYIVIPGFTTTPAPPFQVHITSISGTKVTGTFSGAIPDFAGVNPDLIVQNGQFSVTIYP